MADLNLRQAVRALIVDDDDAILLVEYRFGGDNSVWGPPGGGLDPGETPEDGLRRELHEELGLTDVELGPLVWRRTHIIPMDTGHDGQQDVMFLVRRPRFEPQPAIGWDAMRAERVFDMRWWSLDELRQIPVQVEIDTGEVRLSPRRLADHLTVLLRDGAPDEPIDTGI